MLDPRRLLIFDAVVRETSMTAAAARLGYTQSAVSQAIAALEKEAGTPLLERGARGVRPTSAGEVLVAHAAALRERLELAAADLDAHRTLKGGRLRIGAFASAAVALVPPAVAAFRAAHPGVALSLEEIEPATAADALRDGRLDLALVFAYPFDPVLDPAGVALHPLGDDEMLVALPPGHPAAARAVVPVTALAGETWVASAEPTCNALLTRAAGAAGFEPRVAFASDDYSAVGGLVLAGVGIALVPALAAPTVGSDVVLRRLDPAPARQLAVAVPATPSPAAAAMLAILLSSASGRSTSAAPAPASA